MKVTDLLLEAVERYWGYRELLPHQKPAMEAILNGQDSVVVLPTGGGKSLCFQAPALLRSGLGIVVSPLISLMHDQVDALHASGVPAACYNSAMSSADRARVFEDLKHRQLKLLYVSPERLAGDGGAQFCAVLAEAGASFLAIDEAHCISHWGHEFRPEYRRLGELRTRLSGVSVHAFTATATDAVRLDIAEQLGLREPLHIVGSFDRPNLIYRVQRRDNLKSQITRTLARHRDEAGIIYCITRKDVDKLSAYLIDKGFRAAPYHAGLDPEVRRLHQEQFSNEQLDIIVATVAFGMGIDRSNLRFVIHAGAPRSIEHYQQEAGRAGRDGLPAECLLIWSGADFASWQRILELNGEFTEAAQRHIALMAAYACRVSCRHRALVEHFGQNFEAANCGACDVCLGELEAIDESLILAQKILSCVARVDQRWGTTHVISVLRGLSNDKIVECGHDRLSTFGLLEGMPVGELRAYIEQLLELEFLSRTDGSYPVLKLNQNSWRILRDEADVQNIQLYRIRVPKKLRKRTARKPQFDSTAWEGVDHALFEILRDARREIAAERSVPPYIVCHDTTLVDLARIRPASIDTLLEVHGIGQKKAVDFGDRFIALIEDYCSSEDLPRDQF